jgi:hypothetical protein
LPKTASFGNLARIRPKNVYETAIIRPKNVYEKACIRPENVISFNEKEQL